MTYDTTGTEFSLQSMKNLIKKHTDKRVSKDAATALAEQLEKHAKRQTEIAVENADHAGRSTVQASDYQLHNNSGDE